MNRCESKNENGVQCCAPKDLEHDEHAYASDEEMTCKVCGKVSRPWAETLMRASDGKTVHQDCMFLEIADGRAIAKNIDDPLTEDEKTKLGYPSS